MKALFLVVSLVCMNVAYCQDNTNSIDTQSQDVQDTNEEPKAGDYVIPDSICTYMGVLLCTPAPGYGCYMKSDGTCKLI